MEEVDHLPVFLVFKGRQIYYCGTDASYGARSGSALHHMFSRREPYRFLCVPSVITFLDHLFSSGIFATVKRALICPVATRHLA